MLRVLQRVRRLELLAVGELVSLQEVEQAPQLLDAVLQRRPRDQHLVPEVPLLQLLGDGMQRNRQLLCKIPRYGSFFGLPGCTGTLKTLGDDKLWKYAQRADLTGTGRVRRQARFRNRQQHLAV